MTDRATGEDAPAAAPDEATRVDPRLLEILVCPLTKATLEYDRARQELISRAARLQIPASTATRGHGP